MTDSTSSSPTQRPLSEHHDVAGDEGPEAGHQFHFTVTSQGSYGVDGEDGHTDSFWLGEPWTLTVRAWNLRDALLKAADRGLGAWNGMGTRRDFS